MRKFLQCFITCFLMVYAIPVEMHAQSHQAISYQAFSATPTISVGDFGGTGTNITFLVFTIKSADMDSATVEVYNAGNAAVTYNGNFKAIIIGPQ